MAVVNRSAFLPATVPFVLTAPEMMTSYGDRMKRTIWILVLVSTVRTACLQKKSCEDLKSEISAKLDAKGVKNYELKIVAAEDVKSETVVGSCDGGTKRIAYTRR